MCHILMEVPAVSPRELGAFVAYLLNERGVSQRRLSEEIGSRLRDGRSLAESSVSDRMAGRVRWRHDELEVVAELVGLDGADELLSLAGKFHQRGIPVLGKVPASTFNLHWQLVENPMAADEHVEKPAWMSSRMARECYALKVDGDSMHPEVKDGSVVVVWPAPADADWSEVHDRMVVVSLSDDHPTHPGETTMGWFILLSDGSGIIAKENRRYPPIPVDLDQVVRLGLVEETRVFRPMRRS